MLDEYLCGECGGRTSKELSGYHYGPNGRTCRGSVKPQGDRRGWIGVDLDGTLAMYDGWKGPEHIGQPIAPMVARIKAWLAEGREVRIMTARVSPQANVERAAMHIRAWCVAHIGQALPITCTKDFGMLELWDDRAVRVQANTGMPCCQFWNHVG